MAKCITTICILLLPYILYSQVHSTPKINSLVNLDSGLVLYYPFNGNARDASGNGNHGMVVGITWVADRFGDPQSAAYFDGIDDFIRIPFSSDFDFSETRQISMGFWSDTIGIALTRHARNFIFTFSLGGQPGVTEISGSFHWIRIFYEPIPDKNWHLYFATVNNKYLSFWVDDSLVERRSVYNVKWDKIGLGDLFVGGGGPEYSKKDDFAKGILDELCIYNRILHDEEIRQIYRLKKVNKQ